MIRSETVAEVIIFNITFAFYRQRAYCSATGKGVYGSEVSGLGQFSASLVNRRSDGLCRIH